MEESTLKKIIPGIEEIYLNSYPLMKKRIIGETMDVIFNNPNKAAFSVFLFGELSENNLNIIKEQLSELKSETKENE